MFWKLNWKLDTIEGVPLEINSHGEKIECFMQATRDYIKFIKRGYSRITQLNSFKTRKNILTTEEASQINRALDGVKPQSLEIFLEYVGLTEEEFQELTTSMSVYPYEHDFSSERIADKPWDFDDWYREDNRKK